MSFLSRLFGKPQTPAADAKLEAVATAATAARDGMMNVLTRMGTPGGDKRRGNVYATPPVLSELDLDNMYAGSWLAGKIIDIPVDDMTRMGWSRKWDGIDKDQESVRLVQAAEERFAVPARVTRVAKWGRLYSEAYLVPIIKGQRLDQPLVLDSIKQGMLVNFLELDAYDLTPNTLIDDNEESPNAGYPLTYRWNQKGLDIHWSRLVKFGGRELTYRKKKQQQYRDDSVLRRVVEVIMNYDGAEGGIASLILEAKIDILALRGLAAELAEDGGEQRVQLRIQTALLMKSVWNTMVVDAGDGNGGETGNGDRFDHKQISFANLDKILDRLGQSVAGAADIPMTRLFAMSPGGQNSTGESDDDNYDDHIAALQKTYLKPRLNLIDQVLIRSTIGSMPKNYELTFNPLTQADPKEAADIMKTQMEALTGYVAAGTLPEQFVSRQLKAWGTFSALEDADVDMMQDLAEQREEEGDKPDPADDPVDDPKRDAA